MSRSIYEASPSDGREILRILESSAAKGAIELLYTRRPDAYESYMKEAGEARVFVSRDGERTVGSVSFVPSAAGLVMASEAVRMLTE